MATTGLAAAAVTRQRSGRHRAAWFTAIAAVALTLLVGGAGTAHAGGAEFAACPSGLVTDVSGAYNDYVDAEHLGVEAENYALASLARLDSGFYAQSGVYWPPSTVIACASEAGPGKPIIKVQPKGCPIGWHGFDIPQGGPTPTIEWGTFLPEGFYTIGSVKSEPGWATVCRAPVDLVPLTELAATSSPSSA